MEFKTVVEDWLGISGTIAPPNNTHKAEATQVSQVKDLQSLLRDKLGKSLTEESFAPIRQAIIEKAILHNIEYVRLDRRATLSAKPLNRILKHFSLPYCVKKKAKKWKIENLLP